jgi:hypothetical protein
MGLSLAGVAAGYQGYANETARLAEEDRRAKAEQRAEQDASFQEESRGRQRTDWQEQDRIKADRKRDIAAVNAKYDGAADAGSGAADQALAQQQVKDDQTQAQIDAAQAAPADPTVAAVSAAPAAPADSIVTGAATPAWAKAAGVTSAKPDSVVQDPAIAAKLRDLAPPAGVPKPRSFNDTLAKQSELLRLAADRGDLKPQDYAQGMQLLNTMRTEGVNDALKAFSAGDYQGGMDAFNQIGKNRGSRIVSGAEGVTKINGQDVPTHFVTIANPDGSQTVIDSARAQYQLLDLNSQLAHVDRARQTDMQARQHADQIALGRDQLAQSAKDAAAGRSLQAQQLQLTRMQFDASTPLGKINSMSAALKQPLSTDQIENLLGVSKIPRAVELQVQSLMKENDTESQAMARAIASPEGMNPAAAATFQKNAAIRNGKLNQLLQPYSGGAAKAGGASADPLNLNGQLRGTIVPNPLLAPAAAPAAAAPQPVLRQPAGLQAAVAAAPVPVGTVTEGGGVNVVNDPILTSLRKTIGGIDMQDPKNLDVITKFGKARNDRIAQLQANYGTTKLITD